MIRNPIELAIVSAEPTYSGGAFFAFRAENWGESPTTVIPQIKRKMINKVKSKPKNSGDNRQQAPDTVSWIAATFALPTLAEIIPPTAQPKNPAAITRNDHSGTLRVISFVLL